MNQFDACCCFHRSESRRLDLWMTQGISSPASGSSMSTQLNLRMPT